MSANEAETPILPAHADARRRRDVLEPAAAQVPPELVAADLADEVDVRQAVAIDVGDRDAVAMVVVRRLVLLPASSTIWWPKVMPLSASGR